MDVNKVFLLGNVGQDPELRYSSSGLSICSFSVATNEGFKDQSGNKETEWHRVVSFGKTAEACVQYAKKGHKIHVEGRIKSSEYKNKNGETRKSFDIIADKINFIGRIEKTEKVDEVVEPDRTNPKDDLPF